MKEKIKKITRKQWIIGISIFILLVIGISVLLFVRIINNKSNKEDKMCHVQFETLGGTKINGVEVPCGGKINKPDIMPEKEGFEFVSWYYLDDVFDFDSVINEDIILQAKYFLIDGGEVVLVNFNSNGGSFVQSVEVLKGTTITEPVIPTRINNTFQGWYLNEEKFDFSTPINESITLNAKWKANSISSGGNSSGKKDPCVTSNLINYISTDIPLNYKGTIFSYLMPNFSYSGNCSLNLYSETPDIISVGSNGELYIHKTGRAHIVYEISGMRDADDNPLGSRHHYYLDVKERVEDKPSEVEKPDQTNNIKYDDIRGVWYQQGAGHAIMVTFSSETSSTLKGLDSFFNERLDDQYDKNFSSFKELVAYYDIKKVNSEKITLTRYNRTITLVRNQNAIKVSNVKIDIPSTVTVVSEDEWTVQMNTINNFNLYVDDNYVTNVNLTYNLSDSYLIKMETFHSWFNIVGHSSYRMTFTGLRLGSAYLTIKSEDGGYKKKVKINVVKRPVDSVTINHKEVSLKLGEKISLYADVSPMGATYRNVTWTSSDESVAVVSSGGTVTAKGKGVAIITATADGVSDTSTVSVTLAPIEAQFKTGFSHVCVDSDCGWYYSIHIVPSGGTQVYSYSGNISLDGVSLGTIDNEYIYVKKKGTYRINYTITDSEGNTKSGVSDVVVD